MAKQTPSTTGFKSAALSDQGVRGNNEDLVYNDDDRGIYFVIDGMGGHAAGEHAAQIASERLRGRLERATGSPQQRVREAIALANNAIFESASQNPDWKGMACVLTVALISSQNGSQTAIIGHVGDSRLYKILGTSLEKITLDHSPVGELEDTKQLTEAQAMAHPRRNEVYRDVGSAPHDPDDKDFIDIYEVPAEPESGLLLCSDGLTDAVPLADIRRIIRENVKDPSAAAQSLINQAKAQNSKDNISVVLVQGPAFGSRKRNSVPVRQMKELAPEATARPIVITEYRTPMFQRVAWLVFGMLLGAALYYAAQQAIHQGWFASTPPVSPQKAANTPATIVVNPRQPGAQSTIAAALTVANDGDTIELTPGIYQEPVHIDRNNILIEGSGALLHLKPSSEGSDGITISGASGVRIQDMRIAGDADGNLLTGVRIVNSHVTLRNVHVIDAAGAGIETGGASTLRMEASSVRDCSGPGLLLRGPVEATVKYTAIVGNGREPGDRQPGIMIESTLPVALVGNTIANNGGPAISQPGLPSQEMLTQNLFSLDGRKGRLDDVRVNRKRGK